MREIKFRAWDKEEDELVTWEDFTEKYHNQPLFSLNGQKPYSHLVFMQYTGLEDKNGKEIYEGDIVEVAEDCKTHGRVQDDGTTLWNVIDAGLRFEVGWNTLSPTIMLYPTSNSEQVDIDTVIMWLWNSDGGSEGLKVIGNIHENPELLATPTI